MVRIVLLNKKGVTLIEMMISLVILLIVSLALMQTALLGMSTNVANQLRNEAVNIVESRMNQLRSLPFTDAVTHGDLAAGVVTETAVSRNFRGFSINYAPTRTIANINTDLKQISVSVTWSYKGQTLNHSIVSIMTKHK